MSIPGHKSTCKTRGWWTTCQYCGQKVFYLECTCGSKIFFDDIGDDWPKHIESCPFYEHDITHYPQGDFSKEQLNKFIQEVKERLETLLISIQNIDIVEIQAESNSAPQIISDGYIAEIRKINLLQKANLPENQFTRSILGNYANDVMCEVIIESNEIFDNSYNKQWHCLMSISDISLYNLRIEQRLTAELRVEKIFEDLYFWIIDDFNWIADD